MSRIVIHLYIFFVENIRHSANKSPDNSTHLNTNAIIEIVLNHI